MTKEEAKSCIGTIEMLQRLAYNIHGVMDVIDADNCKKIIKALEKEPKTGHWMETTNEYYVDIVYCSECKSHAPFVFTCSDHYGRDSHGEFKKTKYCPNCGVKMEEEG